MTREKLIAKKSAPWWKEHPWRMIQTNLREIDMGDLSAERFVADLLDFHATVVLLNAAGISAGYDTKLPYHIKNPYLTGDSLKKIVDLCHENGIRVIARADFSKVRQEVYEMHPQWAFRTSDGDVMEQNGYVQTCLCGEYQQKYAFEIIEELFREIPFDGLYCNMGGFQTRDYKFHDYGFCHCSGCRSGFKAFSGKELPDQAWNNRDLEDPVWKEYEAFQKTTVKAYRKKMSDFLKGISPEICFDDVDYGRIEAATEISTRLPHWIYHASSNCRAILGDGSSGMICSNTTVSYPGYGLRHASVSPSLHAMRLWQNLANLGALDFYLIGRLDTAVDRSGFPVIKKIFAYHQAHEEDYKGLRSTAKVLLRRKDRWVATEEEKGWIRVLTEAHILFAEILPDAMKKADLSKYQVVILGDEGDLDRQEADQLDHYVRQGGILVSSGLNRIREAGSSTYEFLKSSGVLGLRKEDRKVMSSQLLLDQEEKSAFPSHQEIDAIPVGDVYIFLEWDKDSQTFWRYVPPQPFGPPECCFSTEVWEDPGLIVYRYGSGKCLTIPWLPGSFYSRTGHGNTVPFMRDILTKHCGLHSVAKELTPMVEVTVSEDDRNHCLVQLVNNSGAFGLTFFEPLPVENIRLEIAVKAPPAKVVSLMGGNVKWQMEGKMLHLLLEHLEDYDAIKIEIS